jgi:hypothetical protein
MFQFGFWGKQMVTKNYYYFTIQACHHLVYEVLDHKLLTILGREVGAYWWCLFG